MSTTTISDHVCPACHLTHHVESPTPQPIRERMLRERIEGLYDSLQQTGAERDRLADQLREAQERADVDRVVRWAHGSPRVPPSGAFTAGPERRLADVIHELIARTEREAQAATRRECGKELAELFAGYPDNGRSIIALAVTWENDATPAAPPPPPPPYTCSHCYTELMTACLPAANACMMVRIQCATCGAVYDLVDEHGAALPETGRGDARR